MGLLQKALAAQKAGNLPVAEQSCRDILAVDANQPDALQFLGLICRNTGRVDEGEALMRRSLAANPKQPHVWSNLGNILRTRGQFDEALACYDKAIFQNKDYMDAYQNRGLVRFDKGDFEGALADFSHVLSANPQHLAALNMVGSCHRHMENYDKAEEAFKKVLMLKPDHVGALHNLGLTYKVRERHDAALAMYQKAMAIDPTVPELNYNMGNALFEKGELDKSIAAFERTLAIKPDYLEAHKTLNMIYWQYDMLDKHLKSYTNAMLAVPQSLPLRQQYAEELIMHDRMEEAYSVLEKALKAFGEDYKTHYLMARSVRPDHNPVAAEKHFETAIALNGDDLCLLQDFARLLIIRGEYDRALKLMEQAEPLSPEDQQTIAYKGVCWAQMGDERANWLNDVEKFIRPFRIEAPEGYASVEEFNDALKAALLKMHTAKNQPIEQTLRGGTQTNGGLLYRPIKEIQEARGAFEKAIQQYIADLPYDPDHPLMRRKSNDFKFSGSWSVRLQGEGFHINHVHPDGWLSACYYVDAPDAVDDEEAKQGWIKFGETSMYMKDRETIAKAYKPAAGLLVIFPSYMYHGTIPFHSSAHRLTLPMDVVPA